MFSKSHTAQFNIIVTGQHTVCIRRKEKEKNEYCKINKLTLYPVQKRKNETKSVRFVFRPDKSKQKFL